MYAFESGRDATIAYMRQGQELLLTYFGKCKRKSHVDEVGMNSSPPSAASILKTMPLVLAAGGKRERPHAKPMTAVRSAGENSSITRQKR